MSEKKIKIICTLGPKSINSSFLKFSNNNVNLLRLNMSHLTISQLAKSIKFIRKYSKIPVCIDTEGAQIRTKVKKEKNYRRGQKLKISNLSGDFCLYPGNVYSQLKVNDILNIGFSNLNLKVINLKNKILCKVITAGKLENNKGVYVKNRKIKLNYLTEKDFRAIEVGKKLNINYFALSFTNSLSDIIKFNQLLKNKNKIFKIETLNAVRNFKSILKRGQFFLIDRGDLSKDVDIENMPIVQRKLFKMKKKYNNKKIFVATNLLESMLENSYPNRGEANDIYNSLEMGAEGLVLAGETAVGKHPKNTVRFLQKMIKVYKKSSFKI